MKYNLKYNYIKTIEKNNIYSPIICILKINSICLCVFYIFIFITLSHYPINIFHELINCILNYFMFGFLFPEPSKNFSLIMKTAICFSFLWNVILLIYFVLAFKKIGVNNFYKNERKSILYKDILYCLIFIFIFYLFIIDNYIFEAKETASIRLKSTNKIFFQKFYPTFFCFFVFQFIKTNFLIPIIAHSLSILFFKPINKVS